jgi:GNAT superfamily N-acetyltransferase
VIPVKYRQAEDADMGFVRTTWVHHNRGRGFASGVSPREYGPGQRELVAKLLDRYGASVACDPEDPYVLYGWVCSGGDALHYVYVKPEFRGAGIGRAMLDFVGMGGVGDDDLRVTHWHPDLKRRFGKHRQIRYDPYPLFSAWRDHGQD